jgi:hypothetical protein
MPELSRLNSQSFRQQADGTWVCILLAVLDTVDGVVVNASFISELAYRIRTLLSQLPQFHRANLHFARLHHGSYIIII